MHGLPVLKCQVMAVSLRRSSSSKLAQNNTIWHLFHQKKFWRNTLITPPSIFPRLIKVLTNVVIKQVVALA